MKIVYVTEFFSEEMGYSENCLPKAMASLGQEVHVISSDLQVYGNLPNYDDVYGKYLGPRNKTLQSKQIDGFMLHRLPHSLWGGYVNILGLKLKVEELQPDIIQTINCVSINTMKIAVLKILIRFKLFTECHQHLSIVKPYLLNQKSDSMKRIIYFLTRTLPGRIVSLLTEKCYPIADDCAEVAHSFYGVQKKKIRVIPLGTDTELFTPVVNEVERVERSNLRSSLGIDDSEIVCIYTGRFSKDKNPLLLAEAINILNEKGLKYRAVFIGDGPQKQQIMKVKSSVIIDFIPYYDLPKYYRASDIGVWPTQESTSMLDAASCGLPIVVSNGIGTPDRIGGNGAFYEQNDVVDLSNVLNCLGSERLRHEMGQIGRVKMLRNYSWRHIAEEYLNEYSCALP